MKSLSARLLVLTIFFVMMAEVLIFVPSVARFRHTYLSERLEAAHLAILVLDAAPDGMVSQDMSAELLHFIGAQSVAVERGDSKLSLMLDMPPPIDVTVALDEEGLVAMIGEALAALTRDEARMVRLIAASPRDPSIGMELVLSDGNLNAEVQAFAGRIFLLSVTISVLTAFMVFLVLRTQLVRPLKRLSRNMVRFRAHPEDQSLVIRPSGRADEVGVAERELAVMQNAIRDALTQRKHLAALGTAVAKISHDLRGILSSALIVSDRLESSEDPEVRRIAPGILDAIDRAVQFCERSLKYVGTDRPVMELGSVGVAAVIEEAGFGIPNGAQLKNDVESSVTVHADRTQLFRIFKNLIRNAAESGAGEIAVEARNGGTGIEILVSDNGPGMPPRAEENLFKPFEGSGKAGGTGLGLSISRELARAHGGDLSLVRTGPDGTVFCLSLPVEPRSEAA